MIYFKRRVSSSADSLKPPYRFIPESNRKSTTASFLMWQQSSHVRSHSTRRKMMMIYFKRRVSSFADSLKSLYRFIPESNRKSTTASFFMWQKPSHVRSHSTRRKMIMIYFKRRVPSFADSLKSLYRFIPESNRKSTTASFFMWQKSSHVRSHSTRRKMMMIYFKRRVSSFADSLKSLYRFIPENNRKSTTASFFMRKKSSHLRSHSTRRKMMMIYFKRRVSSFADSLKSLYRFIPESNRKSTTASFFMWQKSSHVRSHSTRRKMMMIYFKRRVSSFADSLKSLYRFIPESNRKSTNTLFFYPVKIKTPQVVFNATKDDDDLLQKKSVIFCWLTEVTLSLHTGK